jgi:hypothetical protein
MKLVYNQTKPALILYPVHQRFTKGDTIEVKEKEHIKALKQAGFVEAKPLKTKGDDK